MFVIEKTQYSMCVEKAEDNSFGRFVIEPLKEAMVSPLGQCLAESTVIFSSWGCGNCSQNRWHPS